MGEKYENTEKNKKNVIFISRDLFFTLKQSLWKLDFSWLCRIVLLLLAILREE